MCFFSMTCISYYPELHKYELVFELLHMKSKPISFPTVYSVKKKNIFAVSQVQHIVTETRDKIMQFKSKMADEADLRRRLASLEESVELHDHMKRQVIECRRQLLLCIHKASHMRLLPGLISLFFFFLSWQALAEFEMYRQRMEDSQLCTEAQHTQRVVSMSREVRPP